MKDKLDCFADLPSPCLIVDKQRMLANLQRLQTRLAGSDAVLRPHLKTVKCVQAARLAVSGPQGPAAVSTLKEAEVFGVAGITDLLYAVCLSPQKLARVSALRNTGIDLKVVVDSVFMAQTVAQHCRQTGEAIPTLIELDVDGHRSGVALDQAELAVAIGRILHEAGALVGVMSHAGESYNLSDAEQLAAAAEHERAGTVQMAETLRAAGLPCAVVSIGSTPTAFSAASFEGVTEVRAGVCLFFDLVQHGIGVCSLQDIALSVLTTVIGQQADKGWIIVDAGWMALSSDRGTAEQAVDQYLGLVCDVQGQPLSDLVVLAANQEHGIIAVRPGSSAQLPDLPIGSRLRILPNHACATSAQHQSYFVTEEGQPIEQWPRFNGW